MNKRGLEFSINFIVILILAIVTLVMGIIIFNIIFSGGTELEKEISERTKNEINRLLMTGEEFVVIPDNFKEMSQGDVHSFGLGIRNKGPRDTFTVTMEFDTAVDGNNQPQNIVVSDWFFNDLGSFTIDKNRLEIVKVPISIKSNARKGWTYVFNVHIRDSKGDLYSSVQKIYIIID